MELAQWSGVVISGIGLIIAAAAYWRSGSALAAAMKSNAVAGEALEQARRQYGTSIRPYVTALVDKVKSGRHVESAVVVRVAHGVAARGLSRDSPYQPASPSAEL